MLQNVSSAAVVIGALRVKSDPSVLTYVLGAQKNSLIVMRGSRNFRQGGSRAI